ncbi:MAG: hypothetical protein ACLVEX_02480 [Ruthenibacterium lactatiformans]
MKKEKGLLDIPDMTLILPLLLVSQRKNLQPEMMPQTGDARIAHSKPCGRAGVRFLLSTGTLKIGGSPLLCDLYSNIEPYHDLTFFTEQCPVFMIFLGPVPFAGVIMDIVMKDTDLFLSG